MLLLVAANKQTTAGFGLGAIETAVEYWEASMDGCHVVMMGRFCKQSRRVDAIPDPWSGGQQGFEKVGPGVVCLHTALAKLDDIFAKPCSFSLMHQVLDLLEDACVGLLEELAKTHDLV